MTTARKMTKSEIVERLRYLGCPAVLTGSVARNVQMYPKDLLLHWLDEWTANETRRDS